MFRETRRPRAAPRPLDATITAESQIDLFDTARREQPEAFDVCGGGEEQDALPHVPGVAEEFQPGAGSHRWIEPIYNWSAWAYHAIRRQVVR